MDVSCAFAPGFDTPDHIALAESLGYRRAWVYDSPALYADVWATLALAATRTTRIGLGPAVVVPALRHPMVNAAAIAQLCGLAPERVAVAVGSGFTGAFALGRRPLPWSRVGAYIEALRGLLAGDEVTWDGAAMSMLHPDGFAPRRPVGVSILVAAQGPKGLEVARDVGDGVFSASINQPVAGFAWSACLCTGTVLEEGETPDSPRVLEAAGPGAAVAYHFLLEHEGRAPPIAMLPGGAEWKAAVMAEPTATRHLAVHDLHLVGVTARDRAVLTAETAAALTFTGPPAELRARLEAVESGGCTEVAYQPAGPDIARELRTFAAMAELPA